MKCRKCGFVFDEGIFCPECGEKNAENILEEQTAEQQKELLKKQEQLIEQEKNNLILKKELAEQTERVKKEENERLAKEKEIEIHNLEKEKILIAQRTYAGITYRTEEEAILAREDNEKVEALKNRLLRTRKQTDRKKLCDSFQETLTNPMAKQRLELLQEKTDKKMPIGILLNWIFDGISFGAGIILFIIVIILACIAPDADISMIIGLIWMIFGMITTPVAVVWTIISIIIISRKNYYRNIKHI